MSFLHQLTNVVTYWPPDVPDGYGGMRFGSPILISARWELRTQMIMTPDGKERLTRIRAFLAQEVEIGGYLALGHVIANSPHEISDAHQIIDFRLTPSLDGTKFQRVALL